MVKNISTVHCGGRLLLLLRNRDSSRGQLQLI